MTIALFRDVVNVAPVCGDVDSSRICYYFVVSRETAAILSNTLLGLACWLYDKRSRFVCHELLLCS